MPHRDDPLFGAEVFDTGVRVAQPEAPGNEEDPESTVSRMIEEALQWRQEHLDPELEKATDYYRAEPFGDEEEGRSQVVDTAVRDVVQSIMPSLMRIFFGPDEIVEFLPEQPDDVPVAEAMTSAVNFVIREDNRGFTTFHAMFKDALIRKLGIVKYWWEEKRKVLGSEHTGLNAEMVALLQREPGVEVEFLNPEDEDRLIEAQGETFEVIIRRVQDRGQVQIEALPPEEFIFSPSARSKQDARLIGHIREMPGDELVAMGVDPEQVEKHKGKKGRDPGSETLKAARRIDGQQPPEDEQTEATRDVPFAEVYVKLDMDGDGVSERHRIWCIGDGWEFAKDVNGEIFDQVVDEPPFAIFCPDPEPHTIDGLSAADNVMDLQRIKSAVTRGMLDSLTQHLRPMTEVVEGEVNVADLKNPEVGRFVRVKRPGMMREVPTDFVGADALSVLQYTDEMKENRTGMSKAAAGLDADALQSSTKAAVAATLSASQQRIELIARIFAETGMRDLFNGIARLMVQHQDFERMVRINGEFVPMDPRQWNADMDVTANVGLGSGLFEERLQILNLVAQKQEALLQNGAPIVGFREYRNTLGRMVQLAGFENDSEFFKPFGEQEEQQFRQQQAQAEQEPSVEELLVQVEMAKLKQKREEALMDNQLKAREVALKDDRERDKIIRDFIAKMEELGVEVEEAKLQAARDALDQDIEQARLTGDILEKLANIEIDLPGQDTDGN